MKPIILNKKCTDFFNSLDQPVYNVGVQNDDDKIVLMMHDDIGDAWMQTDSNSVSAILDKNPEREVHVRINSAGGSAYDGIAIYNAFVAHQGKITATIEGLAFSAASVLSLGADHIQIAGNASTGCHLSSVLAYGNKLALLDVAQWLEVTDQALIETYAARTGKDVETVTEWMKGIDNDGTLFGANDALEAGLVDEVMPLKTPGKDEVDDRRKKWLARGRELQMRRRRTTA